MCFSSSNNSILFFKELTFSIYTNNSISPMESLVDDIFSASILSSFNESDPSSSKSFFSSFLTEASVFGRVSLVLLFKSPLSTTVSSKLGIYSFFLTSSLTIGWF